MIRSTVLGHVLRLWMAVQGQLTLLAVTGLTVGKMKIIVTNEVQMQAHALTKKLALPMCHGPGSNWP